MLKLTSIASTIWWYGEPPGYFPYFLHSCSFNPSVDFYIITDNQTQIDDKPDNLKIICFSKVSQLITAGFALSATGIVGTYL